MNFEEAIINIDNSISIQKRDREIYAKDFDEIRDFILNIMKKTDPVFKKIYAGPSLFGSYLDNIKIDIPDEFDVHFLLKLPFYDDIKVKRDNRRPGFVRLSLNKCLEKMRADNNHLDVYNKFKDFVCYGNFLIRCRVQNWLCEIIEEAFQSYVTLVKSSDGKNVYKLYYSKRGTAHTIKAISKSRKISIDFVPAFKFNATNDWFAERPFPKCVKENLWFAVPKPSVGPKKGRRLTFSICVPQAEKHLLVNKYNLKPSLRLLKALRDKCDEKCRLKSYFIKSIYLHLNDTKKIDFWMRPLGELLLLMLDELITCLEEEEIKFYWCPSMNLLDSVEDYELEDLIRELSAVKDILEDHSQKPFVNFKFLKSLFSKGYKVTKEENF